MKGEIFSVIYDAIESSGHAAVLDNAARAILAAEVFRALKESDLGGAVARGPRKKKKRKYTRRVQVEEAEPTKKKRRKKKKKVGRRKKKA